MRILTFNHTENNSPISYKYKKYLLHISIQYLLHISIQHLLHISIQYLLYISIQYLLHISIQYILHISIQYILHISIQYLFHISIQYLLHISIQYLLHIFIFFTYLRKVIYCIDVMYMYNLLLLFINFSSSHVKQFYTIQIDAENNYFILMCTCVMNKLNHDEQNTTQHLICILITIFTWLQISLS